VGEQGNDFQRPARPRRRLSSGIRSAKANIATNNTSYMVFDGLAHTTISQSGIMNDINVAIDGNLMNNTSNTTSISSKASGVDYKDANDDRHTSIDMVGAETEDDSLCQNEGYMQDNEFQQSSRTGRRLRSGLRCAIASPASNIGSSVAFELHVSPSSTKTGCKNDSTAPIDVHLVNRQSKSTGATPKASGTDNKTTDEAKHASIEHVGDGTECYGLGPHGIHVQDNEFWH